MFFSINLSGTDAIEIAYFCASLIIISIIVQILAGNNLYIFFKKTFSMWDIPTYWFIILVFLSPLTQFAIPDENFVLTISIFSFFITMFILYVTTVFYILYGLIQLIFIFLGTFFTGFIFSLLSPIILLDPSLGFIIGMLIGLYWFRGVFKTLIKNILFSLSTLKLFFK